MALASSRAEVGAQARIHDGVEQVDHQVDRHEHERHQHQVGGHDRDVDVLHRAEEQQPHARPLEHVFGDQREGDDRAELQAGDGDHGHQRVLQRMAEMDGPVATARGRGRT